MPEFKIKFKGREMPLADGVTTIGRSSENAVAFPEDPNVSRFHAEIESNGGDHRLIDLGSSNGTSLNGNPVRDAVYLSDGDLIVLGGSSEITFEAVPDAAASPAEPAAAIAPSAGSGAGMPNLSTGSPVGLDSRMPGATVDASGSGTGLIVAGAAVSVLVVLLAVGAVAYYVTRKPVCSAKARIVKPETGDTIAQATDIEIEVENSSCVGKVVFSIDGVEFASADEPPYDAAIDPKEFPDLADGLDHSLSVILQDDNGQPIGQPAPILLAFETREIAKPKQDKEIVATNTQSKELPAAKSVSLIDVQAMSGRLVKQFSGNFAYNLSNKQFLLEVQKRTADYAQEGYFERAARYGDAINVAYAREQNVDASLGFILAMSRSKFNAERQGEGEGLWKLSTAFVTAGGYNGLCGSETLSDPSQNCAAKSSALYMKQIFYPVFEGDAVYSAVVFGKSPQDAAAWKATLPANRSDLWNVIKTPQEREQLIRFFAAGIVAENPQKFGLKKDRPLSELYKLTM